VNQVSPASPPEALFAPQVRLDGNVDDEMLRAFKAAFAEAEAGEDPIVVELTTPGGDADVGRRIGSDILLFRKRTGRRLLFFGKATVYSAGVTIMSAFPREDRWLARGTALLIHSRSLAKSVDLNAPLAVARKQVEALLNEIDTGLALQRQDFEQLVRGSRVELDDLLQRAETDWYLDAAEAVELGLAGGLV